MSSAPRHSTVDIRASIDSVTAVLTTTPPSHYHHLRPQSSRSPETRPEKTIAPPLSLDALPARRVLQIEALSSFDASSHRCCCYRDPPPTHICHPTTPPILDLINSPAQSAERTGTTRLPVPRGDFIESIYIYIYSKRGGLRGLRNPVHTDYLFGFRDYVS